MEHLQKILFLLPEAYAFASKQRDPSQPPVLTIRKRRLPGVDAVHDTLTDRIDAFSARVNAFLKSKIDGIRTKPRNENLTDEELQKELDAIEIEKAPLPQVTDLQRKKTKQALEAVTNGEKSVTEQEMEAALEAPVPEDLKSLPSWLIEKVCIAAFEVLMRACAMWSYIERLNVWQ